MTLNKTLLKRPPERLIQRTKTGVTMVKVSIRRLRLALILLFVGCVAKVAGVAVYRIFDTPYLARILTNMIRSGLRLPTRPSRYSSTTRYCAASWSAGRSPTRQLDPALDVSIHVILVGPRKERPQWYPTGVGEFMPRGNPSPKLAITIDPDIHENVLKAAARDGVSVSAWMTSAAREALRRRAGLAAIDLWEEQHGRFTAEEMDQARRRVRAQLRKSRSVRRSA